MGQALSGRFREHVHDLKADAQNRVCRHRTVRAHPGIRGFTFQIFGYENEVIVLDSDIKNLARLVLSSFCAIRAFSSNRTRSTSSILARGMSCIATTRPLSLPIAL